MVPWSLIGPGCSKICQNKPSQVDLQKNRLSIVLESKYGENDYFEGIGFCRHFQWWRILKSLTPDMKYGNQILKEN